MKALSEDEAAAILTIMDADYSETAHAQLNVFVEAMWVFQERERKYGGLWKEYGWKGVLLHVQSKAARLRRVFWDQDGEPAKQMGEPVGSDNLRVTPITGYDLDDAIDLLNYTAFFVRNVRDGNEKGAR